MLLGLATQFLLAKTIQMAYSLFFYLHYGIMWYHLWLKVLLVTFVMAVTEGISLGLIRVNVAEQLRAYGVPHGTSLAVT